MRGISGIPPILVAIVTSALALGQGTIARLTTEGGSPGSEVTLQTVLAAVEPIASLTVTIGYPSELVSFVRAETNSAVQAQLRIDTEVSKSAEAQDTTLIKGEEQTVVEPMEQALLTIEIATDESGTGLGLGPVVDVVFFIGEEAEPETKIPLVLQAKTGSLGQESPTRDAIETENGLIEVLESIIFGCFFYLH